MRHDQIRSTRALMAFAVALALLGNPAAWASTVTDNASGQATSPLRDFIGASGEITVMPHGDVVDPYFAMKALEIGQQGDLDIAGVRQAFIAWTLEQQRQAPPGRYCATAGHWLRCEAPDAEDSRLALWLLVTHDALQSTRRMSGAMRRRVVVAHQAAIDALFALYDDQRHVFTVFQGRPIALFMDNCEVIRALQLIATEPFANASQKRRAKRLRRETLAALPQVFPVHDGLPQVSSEPPSMGDAPNAHGEAPTSHPFYPDVVAALYPQLEGLPAHVPAAVLSYAQWQHRYRSTWLSGRADPYPWGLVAWAAYQVGDMPTACLWHSVSHDRQTGKGWNVLEAAVFESLSAHHRLRACGITH